MAVGPWGRDLRATGSLLARAPGWREGHRDHCLLGLLAGGRVTGIIACKGFWLEGGVGVGAQGSLFARALGWRERHRDHCLRGILAGGRGTGIIACECC